MRISTNKMSIPILIITCVMYCANQVKNTPTTSTVDKKQHTKVKKLDASSLTGKKWYLAEMLRTKSDLDSNNLVFMMHSCEKDNFTQYVDGGRYTIHEGASICKEGDTQIKGEGEWEFDVDNATIYESYAGGKEVEKKVIELTDDIYKIEFPTSDESKLTITYLSEESYVNRKKEIEEEVEEEIEEKQELSYPELARDVFSKIVDKSSRHILVPYEKIELPEEMESYQKTVAILPFTEKGNEIKMDTQSEFLDKVDYIITGSFTFAEFDSLKKRAEMSYDVKVWDTNIGDFTTSGTFNESALTDEKRGRIFSTVLGAVLIRHGYYDQSFARDLVNPNSEYNMYFTELNEDRNKLFSEERISVKRAIVKSKKDATSFVDKSLPIHIKLNQIVEVKKNLPKTVRVEGGSNCLEEGELLEIVTFKETKLSSGKLLKETEVLATLIVKTVDNEYLSTCSVKKLTTDFTEIFEKNDPNLFVITTGKIPLLDLSGLKFPKKK